MISAPNGFRLERGPGTFLMVRARWFDEALKSGVLERGGLGRALERTQPGETGRGATALVRCPDDGPTLVVRRLLHGGWLGRLLSDRFLSPNRPIHELALTAELREIGVAVPEPVLVVGERRFGFWHLVLATVLEEDAIDALRWLEAGPSRGEVMQAATAMGRAVRHFHDAGGFHADLHVKNLMLRPAAGPMEALVIDLDGARRVRGMTPEERMSQLMRIFRSLVKRELVETVGVRGFSRFLKAYCGGDIALRRSMWRRVDAELRRIAIHKLAYRSARCPR